MTKLFSNILLACTLLFGGTLLVGTTGCNTTAGNVVAKTEGVIIVSVDTGMQAWSDYVKGGFATQSQVDAVRDAYDKYYNAQQIAKNALVTYLETVESPVNLPNKVLLQKATEAASAASTDLINLIRSFTRK